MSNRVKAYGGPADGQTFYLPDGMSTFDVLHDGETLVYVVTPYAYGTPDGECARRVDVLTFGPAADFEERVAADHFADLIRRYGQADA